MRAPPTYWRGVAIGLLLFGVVAGCLFIAPHRDGAPPNHSTLAFDPEVYNLSQPWILPGDARQFEAILKNLSSEDIWIDELRFSCSCATGRVGEQNLFPVRLPARGTLPVRIVVKSEHGESGPVHMRFGVVGRSKSRAVDAGAVADFLFVQKLNVEPPFLAVGELASDHPITRHLMTLWVPAEVGLPREMTVEADDPSVDAATRRLPEGAAPEAGRINVAELSVSIDPAKAPERLSTRVVVAYDGGQIVIPVFGFFNQPESGKQPP